MNCNINMDSAIARSINTHSKLTNWEGRICWVKNHYSFDVLLITETCALKRLYSIGFSDKQKVLGLRVAGIRDIGQMVSEHRHVM